MGAGVTASAAVTGGAVSRIVEDSTITSSTVVVSSAIVEVVPDSAGVAVVGVSGAEDEVVKG